MGVRGGDTGASGVERGDCGCPSARRAGGTDRWKEEKREGPGPSSGIVQRPLPLGRRNVGPVPLLAAIGALSPYPPGIVRPLGAVGHPSPLSQKNRGDLSRFFEPYG